MRETSKDIKNTKKKRNFSHFLFHLIFSYQDSNCEVNKKRVEEKVKRKNKEFFQLETVKS
jgi:hypothetical protein